MTEIWSSIIVAVLAMVGTIVGSVLSANKTQALIGYRLTELEKKVEKHNQVVERTYSLEKDVGELHVTLSEIKEDIKELKNHEQ